MVPSAERETFLFFRGGCGSPDPEVRPYFAAGKMLRWALVRALNAAPQPDLHESWCSWFCVLGFPVVLCLRGRWCAPSTPRRSQTST